MQSLAGRVGGKGGGIVSFVVRVSRLESTCCHCAWCKAIQDILGVILVVKDNNLFLLKMLLHGGIFSQKHSKKRMDMCLMQHSRCAWCSSPGVFRNVAQFVGEIEKKQKTCCLPLRLKEIRILYVL